MILPIVLIILLNGIILTLAEASSSDNEQQRLIAQFGEVPSPKGFPMINLGEQNSQESPQKNFKVSNHTRNETSINDNRTTNMFKTDAFKEASKILFSDISHQRKVLELLLYDIQRGNHLLLVDERGLENKNIADRLLKHLNRPTEFTQLHDSTTIQSLTVQPIVENGAIIYEDTPLVKAVKYGYVLVVDEADKAPTKVTNSLNTLMENREMVLSDGRKMIPKEVMNSSGTISADFIPVHENFRMIIMASRTGFPYLKNSSAPSGLVSRDLYNVSALPLLGNLSRHRRRIASPFSRTGVIGITVKAVGYSPKITTAVMGGYGTGPHTATAIASSTAVATATALTYGTGASTAMVNAAGSSVGTVIAHSHDTGVAIATLNTSGSSVGGASAYAYNAGAATSNVNTAGSSVGDAEAQAYDAAVATAIANSAAATVVHARAIARGNEVVRDIQNKP
ncbi:unnamed protein product [Parnassius apollo]|uniref:(apollo) hypothetical protein n=1 Tax=Parnassius apollo TaxID=110799 RepID=A0A8S3XWN8_PARAO|nr:unnamed protein product [Parnassius apollo]